MRQRLNLILLGVADIGRATGFYQALGWKRSLSGSASFVLFDLGGVALALQSREAFAADANETRSTCDGFAGFALAHIARKPEDVYRILEKARHLGAHVVKDAQQTQWGHSGYFKDLDGHLIEVLYEDGWCFDEHDSLIL